jgi:hypothetical protein
MASKDYNTYIERTFGEVPKENRENLVEAMKKYGDDHWWESADPVTIGMYQLFEPTLMVPFDKFHEGLEKFLDRPVFTHELGINYEELKEEAQLAIRRMKTGIGISDEQRAEAVKRSIQGLENYCQRTGKQFLKIELTEGDNGRDENGVDTSGYDRWLNQD